MTGAGIKTNGIGKRTAAHLNLTRTMADVMREEQDWAPKRRNQWTERDNDRSQSPARKEHEA
jgi:hypothetical protein